MIYFSSNFGALETFYHSASRHVCHGFAISGPTVRLIISVFFVLLLRTFVIKERGVDGTHGRTYATPRRRC